MLKIISKLQTILPHYLLSKLIYKLASWNNNLFKNNFIKLFIKIFKINLQDYQYKNIEDYANFNEFFIRKLDETKRPICTDSPLISPADGHVLITEEITDNKLFQAKGKTYNLTSLLASDQHQDEIFRNGSYLTIYLSPQDYHRVHMPCDGELVSMTYIPGRLFSVNNTSCASINNIFAKNERVVCLFKTNNNQFMAVILVGALLVGSMATSWHGLITPPHGDREIKQWDYNNQKITLQKGDELGYFQMGSTVIVLFSDSINFKNNLIDKHIKYGDSLI